jgi:hypothetical protein
MSWTMIAIIAVILWLLMSFKTSRPDGTFRRKVHPYRVLMQYVMPTRNESVVYFDAYVNAEELLKYLPEAKARFNMDVTHMVVAALNIAIAENPRMNQFISGRRLYQRDGRYMTFSMKREQLNKRAKLSVVKLRMIDGENFQQLCERINGNIRVERSGQKTAADKEYDLFLLLPRPLMSGAAALLRLLDYYNLLPSFFIEMDGMYTSMFIANLGSLGMAPGYHHLYEWGNCPVFVMAGKIEDRVVVVDGEVKAQKTMHLRFSYDERIDDGLTARHGVDSAVAVLENPYKYLGCLAEDGTDAKAMWPHTEETV